MLTYFILIYSFFAVAMAIAADTAHDPRGLLARLAILIVAVLWPLFLTAEIFLKIIR